MTMLPSHFHHSVLRKLSIGLAALGMAISGPGSISADDRLLKPIHTLRVAGIENFVAADRFRIGYRIGGRRLGSVGFNFAEHFLVRVEGPAPAASLAATELLFAMGDTSLVRMFNAQKTPVAHLAHVYAIMEMGEAGASHTDWRSNIAYLRSPVDHRLWAVHWSVNHGGEWTIGAAYVPHAALDWAPGTRVFSAGLAQPTSKTIQNARVGE
jgi:hypothetical protein